MEMPTLPTDNLYKFMAIAGLLLLAGTLYFPTMLQIQLGEQMIQNSESVHILEADQKFHKYKIRKLYEIITNTISMQRGNYTNSLNKMDLVYSDSEIKQMDAELPELAHQDDVNLAKIEANTLRTDYLKFLIGLTRTVQYVLIFLSVLLTFSGFKLWYNRIQKFIDKEVKNYHKPKD